MALGGYPEIPLKNPGLSACTAPEVEVEVVPGPDLGPLVPGSARPGASKAGRVSGVANKAMTSRASKPTLEDVTNGQQFLVVGYGGMCFCEVFLMFFLVML